MTAVDWGRLNSFTPARNAEQSSCTICCAAIDPAALAVSLVPPEVCSACRIARTHRYSGVLPMSAPPDPKASRITWGA